MRSSWTRNSRAHWPNEDAIGKGVRLPWGDKSPTLRVVGVVGRVKINALSEQGGFCAGVPPVPARSKSRNGRGDEDSSCAREVGVNGPSAGACAGSRAAYL